MDDSIKETIDEAKKIRDEVNDTVRAFIKELQSRCSHKFVSKLNDSKDRFFTSMYYKYDVCEYCDFEVIEIKPPFSVPYYPGVVSDRITSMVCRGKTIS